MASRRVLYIVLPVIAVVVILLAYSRLFSSPAVLALIVVLYIIVSVYNRRKFARQEKEAKRTKPT